MKLKRKIFILGVAVIALMSLSQQSFATCTCTWTLDKYTDQSALTFAVGQTFLLTYYFSVNVTDPTLCVPYPSNPLSYANVGDYSIGFVGTVWFG